jgi:hypothetical protein
MKVNFENGNFDLEVIGTHGQGTIDATFEELKHCFGNPRGSHDDHKCDAEWNIKFGSGNLVEIATIYNWKNGMNYCGAERGLRLCQMTSFSVGGFSKNALRLVESVVHDHQLEKELSMQGAHEQFLEHKTNLRVDVSYIIDRLEGVLDSDCIGAEAEDLLEELKKNNTNHMEKNYDQNI